MMSRKDNYKRIATGIYKHLRAGTFRVEKKIKGKVHSRTFSNLYDAKKWYKTFNGHTSALEEDGKLSNCSTLKEVWEAMVKNHFPTLATTTKSIWTRRYQLLKDLEHLPMDHITPSKITLWVLKWVEFFKAEEYRDSGRGRAGRCNLNMELNMFVTIFNWYKESEQFEKEALPLTCPIKKKHRKMGFIRPVPDKKMQIDLKDAFTFFDHLAPLYRDLAMMQFFCAGRIGEIAGLQWTNIDLHNRRMMIKDTCIWDMSSKTFIELKAFPKNRESRPVFITDEIEAILKRQSAFRIPNNDFVFHVDGNPLNYCTIQINYRSAQRKGKIPYTGTHILRHGMAKLARKVGGGLDAVIAMTGHKDLKLADHYSSCNEDDQKDFSKKIMGHIKSELEKHHGVETLKEAESAPNVLSLASFRNGTYN